MTTVLSRCKFCGAPIEWLNVRFGHGKPYRYQFAAVSADPDPTGRVVFWQNEWIYLRNGRPVIVEEQFRRRLHGASHCVESNDKGEQ